MAEINKYLSLEGLKTFWGSAKDFVAANYYAKNDGEALAGRVTTAEGNITTLMGEGEGSVKKALADAKGYTDGKVADINSAAETLGGRVSANETAIATLNGSESVEGSVDKKVKDAINDFATKISDNDTIDTFKELVDYAAAHTSEYSVLAGNVQANAGAIETLNGDENTTGSVKKQVKDAVDAEAAIARAAEKANADAIDAIEADYLKAADKTELQGNIDKKVETSVYEAKVSELEGAINGKLATATYTADKANMEQSIAAKVAQSDYDTKVAALEGADEDFESRITELEGVVGAGGDNSLTDRVDAAEQAIDAIEADYLKAADKTELQGKVDTVEASVGLAENGAYIPRTDAHYINNLASIAAEIRALDNQAYKNQSDAAKALSDLATEISNRTTAEAKIREDFAAADTALSGRISTLEGAASSYLTEAKYNGSALTNEEIASVFE